MEQFPSTTPIQKIVDTMDNKLIKMEHLNEVLSANRIITFATTPSPYEMKCVINR